MARALALADEVLLSYGRILFGAGRGVSALLCAATLCVPRVGLCGLGAVLLAVLVVRALRLPLAAAAQGLYGYNALLCGLALGEWIAPGPALLLLLVLSVLAVVLVQAALESVLVQLFNLPALTLPFVLVAWMALLAAPAFDNLLVTEAAAPELAALSALPAFATLYLRGLGALFYVPSAACGLLVLLALLVHSRIAALLSVTGVAAAALVLAQLHLAPQSPLPMTVAYNAAVVAIGLGGFWYVPRPASFVLAAVAALLCALVAVAAQTLLAPLGLPVLILPFNLTVLVALQAMRQRTRDGAPKAVDFAPGTPEANLAYYRTRLARFGDHLTARLRLPFMGRWTVTQGNDGAHTHQGEWRHGLDFEVRGPEGQTFTGNGRALRDHFCYRLPVYAAAAGTVVKVRNDVPDNKPGERNPELKDTWGNVVVVQHGPALFSLVAHLSTGSVEVFEGQYVAAGARLGLCGNSGRSFVPHLHFQVQATARLGAPTAEVQFESLVLETGTGPLLRRSHLPQEGESVRNLQPQDDMAALFSFPIGTQRTWSVTDARGRERRETITSCIDLYNNRYLASDASPHGLYFEEQPHQFLVYDYLGPRGSLLSLLHAAVPRAPFEPPGGEGLRWDDVLSPRLLRPRGTGWLADFAAPFLPLTGKEQRFSLRREGATLWVRGEDASGSPRGLRTEARLTAGTGLTALELRRGERPLLQARLVDIIQPLPRAAHATTQLVTTGGVP